jgi:hypothetical protein
MSSGSTGSVQCTPGLKRIQQRPDRRLLERDDRITWLVVAPRPFPISRLRVGLPDWLASLQGVVVKHATDFCDPPISGVIGAVVKVTKQRQPFDTDQELANADVAIHVATVAHSSSATLPEI